VRVRRLGALAALLLGSASPAASDEPHTNTTSAPTLAAPSGEDLAHGGQLFAVHCAPCHGRDGEGNLGPPLNVPVLTRAPDLASLIGIIRGGVDGTQMPKSGLPLEEIRQVASFVRSLAERPSEALDGDPARGRALYLGKGSCRTCHTLGGQGGAFGPDLGEIGRRRGAEHLRRSLVEPSADVPRSFGSRPDVQIPQNFLLVEVTPKSGTAFTGVRVNEDSFSIQVRDVSGRVRSFFKSELAGLKKEWGVSPMPSYAHLTDPELDDLVAFLASLRGPGPR
jgi:cytochrome c oxidase cbb3-type subunit III